MSITTAAVPDLAEAADRFWTLADLDTLDPLFFELHRIEIVDGRLIVTNRPNPRHAEIARRLLLALTAVLPSELVVLSELYIDLPHSARSPDLVVVPRSLTEVDDIVDLQPSQVLLAVEIESRNSVTEDRVHKPAEYAAAGIPAYWHVTRDEPPLITVHTRPVGSGYARVSAPSPMAAVPYPVDLGEVSGKMGE